MSTKKLRKEGHFQFVARCKFRPCGFWFSGEANATVADSTARRVGRNCIVITAMKRGGITWLIKLGIVREVHTGGAR